MGRHDPKLVRRSPVIPVTLIKMDRMPIFLWWIGEESTCDVLMCGNFQNKLVSYLGAHGCAERRDRLSTPLVLCLPAHSSKAS